MFLFEKNLFFREVLSNIADKSLFDDAFIKDVYQPKVGSVQT